MAAPPSVQASGTWPNTRIARRRVGEQADVEERRHGRGRRVAVRQDEQVVAERRRRRPSTAAAPTRGDVAGHTHCAKANGADDQRAGQQRIEQRHLGAVEAGEVARDQAEHGVAEHAREREQESRVELGDARAAARRGCRRSRPRWPPRAASRSIRRETGPASSATVSGVRKPMVVVWSRRRWRSARKLKVVERQQQQRAQRAVPSTCWVAACSAPPAGPAPATIARNWPRKRIQMTCAAAGRSRCPGTWRWCRGRRTAPRRGTSGRWRAADWPWDSRAWRRVGTIFLAWLWRWRLRPCGRLR